MLNQPDIYNLPVNLLNEEDLQRNQGTLQFLLAHKIPLVIQCPVASSVESRAIASWRADRVSS